MPGIGFPGMPGLQNLFPGGGMPFYPGSQRGGGYGSGNSNNNQNGAYP
jgi:hypothetical protein